MFGREAAVTIRQLKSFAFEIDCKACSDSKGLSGEVLGRQNSKDLPLIWIATVGKSSSEMFSFYNSEGEMIAFFGYNWMIYGRGCRRGQVVKTAKGLKLKRPEI